jgi:xanthine dehydrogenase small subunit
MLPVLLATDATIDLVGPRGERSVPASEFWIGYRRTARAADELVTRIRVPLVEGRRVRYRKVGTRRAQAISKVVLAAAWREDGRAWRDVRIGVGSVAEVPIRARATEAALEGAVAGPDTAERAAAEIEGEVGPIDDVRSTAVYRRTVTGRVLRRMVLDEADRPEPGAPRTGEADR